MFGNVWHAENPCWLPAGLPRSQCTELQILVISSKCVNFAAAFRVFHLPCPKQEIDRRGLFLLPLKPVAGFPSAAKCQDLNLTKQFCVSAADCISLKVLDVSHGSQPESHGSIGTDYSPGAGASVDDAASLSGTLHREPWVSYWWPCPSCCLWGCAFP